jgi:hypothetical protein
MFTDPIAVFREKVASVRQSLLQQFIVLVNAPSEADDRQGFLVCGSGQPVDPTEFTNFSSYLVGVAESDVRDIDETLVFWDAEERREHDEEGSDYHAIVAAKSLSGYLREVLRDSTEPTGIAVEAVLVDTPFKALVVHFDGEMEEVTFTRTPTIRWLAGSTDAQFRIRVTDVLQTSFTGGVATPASVEAAAQRLRQQTGLRAQVFALDELCPEATD